MKATFLGHGLDSGDKNNVGKQIVASLEKLRNLSSKIIHI